MSMLKAVIQQNQIGSLWLLDGENLFDGFRAVLVYHHQYFREFLFDLKRLVPRVTYTGADIHYSKSPALSFISSTKHCHLILFRKQPNQVLDMRCFSRASHRDVSNTDNGNIE